MLNSHSPGGNGGGSQCITAFSRWWKKRPCLVSKSSAGKAGLKWKMEKMKVWNIQIQSGKNCNLMLYMYLFTMIIELEQQKCTLTSFFNAMNLATPKFPTIWVITVTLRTNLQWVNQDEYRGHHRLCQGAHIVGCLLMKKYYAFTKNGYEWLHLIWNS